jgi:hypothetical protein
MHFSLCPHNSWPDALNMFLINTSLWPIYALLNIVLSNASILGQQILTQLIYISMFGGNTFISRSLQSFTTFFLVMGQWKKLIAKGNLELGMHPQLINRIILSTLNPRGQSRVISFAQCATQGQSWGKRHAHHTGTFISRFRSPL